MTKDRATTADRVFTMVAVTTVAITVVIIELATIDICVVGQADRDFPGPLCYFRLLVRTRART
jgi:hypothetical protein